MPVHARAHAADHARAPDRQRAASRRTSSTAACRARRSRRPAPPSAQGTTVTTINSTNSAERNAAKACAISQPPEDRVGLAGVAALDRARRCSRSSAKAARSACTCVPRHLRAAAAASCGVVEPRRLAGAHQVRLAAGGGAGLQVAQRVADHRHVAPGRRRSARRSARTGPAAACGSRSRRRARAGRRTPRRCARRAWPAAGSSWRASALSEAMSNRPRPRPDWLVATTACQPAWLSRAIASSAPGSGTHSSGDLTKSSRSSLMMPSRSRMTSFIGVISRQPASRDRSATRFIAACSCASSAEAVGAQRRRLRH